ncbi:hypothetical protein ACJRO7_023620 [Eucalyptus globulus]|uniref:Uncharacterized protein n=1 Tax=Eucalyptus globulus TaxID=34317 RepID=A0ABD3K2J4_EUCGL
MAPLMKLAFLKFRSSFPTTGESQEERLNSLSSKSSIVNREFTQAFRTRSYVEMCTKVQSQIGRTSINRSLSLPSLPDAAHCMAHLSESLPEPGRETLVNMINTLNTHHLLVNYFQASSDACDMCELLLWGIHQTCANCQSIGRAIKLAEMVFEGASHGMRNNYLALFHALMSKHKKMRRRMKLARPCRRVGGLGLIVSSSAIAAAALVLAIDSIIGILAMLWLAASCCVRVCNRKGKCISLSSYLEKSSSTERACAPLDVAAKGVYALINDLDTVSRAGMAVRNYTRMGEIMREVVKEFHVHTACFLEHLEELEEHIYLCLVTMNRSRSLVVEEILDLSVHELNQTVVDQFI